jgi:hypothetical protein
VEVEDIRGLGIEDEADGKFVFEHLARDIVAVTELVTKPFTVGIE